MNLDDDIASGVSGRLDLKGGYALLGRNDQESFWKFAAREIVSGRAPKGVPRATGNPYDGLCAAVEDLERKGGSRPRQYNLPRIVRRLSTDDLSRAVLRLKSRLLDDEYAEPALRNAYCRWVQVEKRAALVAGLRALDCESDEIGTLLGDVKHRDGELARRQLGALVGAHSAHDLSLVCAGLMVNHERWSFLWQACQHLAEAARNPPSEMPLEPFLGTSVALDSEPPKPVASVAEVDQATAPEAPAAREVLGELLPTSAPEPALPDLLNLRADAAKLALLLQQAGEGMTRGRIAPPQEAMALWVEVHRRFLLACSALSQDGSQSLSELEEVAVKKVGQAQRETTAATVARLSRLSNPGDARADYLLGIRSRAAAVAERLRLGELEVADEVVRAAVALVTLVDRHQELEQDEAYTLFSDASAFGTQAALAATRGRLGFDVAATEPHSTAARDGAHPTQRLVPGGGVEPPTLAASEVDSVGHAELVSVPLVPEDSAPADEAGAVVPVRGAVEEATGASSRARPEAQAPASHHPADVEPPVAQEKSLVAPIDSVEADLERRSASIEPSSFETYLTRYWLDGAGRVTPAPWLSSDFVAKLGERARTAWASGQYGLATLFARAANIRGGQVELDAEELIAAAKLVSQPDDLVLARNRNRLDSIRGHGSNLPATAALSLTLEALAPTLPLPVSIQEAEQLVEAVGYHTPMLAEVVRFILAGWVAGTDPVQLLRTELESASASDPAVLQAQLQTSQRKLQEVVATLYSAAGGRIQRTHCRKAWTEFVVKHVAPLRAELAPLPSEKAATPRLASKDVGPRVMELARAFHRIMEANGVKHQDLVVAKTSAEQIVTAVQDVVDSRAQLEQAARKVLTGNPLPVESLRKLMTDLPSDESDRLSTVLLRARVTRKAQANPLLMPTGLLVRCPALLGTVSPAWLASPALPEGLPIDAITDHLAAAALLLDVGGEEVGEAISAGHVLASLKDAAFATGRIELLGTLAATAILQPHERAQLHRSALEVGDETYNQARRLERAWLACDELVHADAAQFRTIASSALERCGAQASESTPFEHLLLSSWVSQQVVVAEAARSAIVRIRIDQAAQRSQELAQEVEAHLSAHRYQSAMALLDPTLQVPEAVQGSARRTMWRTEGLEKFRRPTFALEHELRSSDAVVNHFARAWASTAEDPSHLDKDSIRRTFYEVISGEAGLSQENKRIRFAVKLQDLREHQQKKTVIKCAALREYLKRAKLNPSFLPQLHDYQQLVLMHAGLRGAGNSVDIISKDASQEGAGTLCVFLEPGIPLAKRDDVAAALRRRGVNAAVIDDVDVCRLLAIQDNVEGHNFIPFLEIVFEQLDLETASPFSSLDGQHVRIETFVGRAQAASKVAMTSVFTRLFSGRKLGKSAFLRHVAHSFDGEKTPSKNTLNVIFITIAGGESETWVVDCIIKEMNRRFDLPMESEVARRLSPADRYTAYARRFGEYKASDNVLLILDEADAFVEGQLRAYDRENREGSLSFRMMKESSAGVDSAQMPRIRILFSGYRVTNTRGGVWANAGDVLILQPLAEEEAADFLRGMLGRIGVDIGEHAPFAARRCGYQPAVLIRFGETLLRRLKRNSRSGRRETHVVTYDDVQATMAEQQVLDEIRTVVNNNFQGNRVAATVFAATLLALKDLQPGMSLDDGPSQVLAKIAEVDPDLEWLKQFGPQPLAQIERQLQEFIDRELLAVTDSNRFGAREYRLKFPHFLPVLTQHADLPNEIRLHIQHLRAGAGSNRLIESVLPDASLDAARYWYQHGKAEECAFVVIGGQWASALVDPKVGVPDRLGVNETHVVDARSDLDYGAMLKQDARVFKNVSAQSFERLAELRAKRPLALIGGVDLVRAARRSFLDAPDGGRPIEFLGLGRLSEATTAWWFDVARALHFKSPDASARIFAATAGVPLLVGELDRLLPHSLAADVSASELQTALAALDGGMLSTARQLIDEEGPVSLTGRELELLRMVLLVSTEEPEFDLGEDFPLLWELVAEGNSASMRPPLTDPGDQVALQVLIDAGLVELSSRAATKGGSILGRVQVSAADPVRRLIASLEQAGAS